MKNKIITKSLLCTNLFLYNIYEFGQHGIYLYEGASESSVIGVITVLIHVDMIVCCIIP